MAVIDQNKAKKDIASLNNIGIMSQQGHIKSSVGDSIVDINTSIVSEEQQMDNIYNKVKMIIEKKSLEDNVEIENQPKGVLIRFKDDMTLEVE